MIFAAGNAASSAATIRDFARISTKSGPAGSDDYLLAHEFNA